MAIAVITVWRVSQAIIRLLAVVAAGSVQNDTNVANICNLGVE